MTAGHPDATPDSTDTRPDTRTPGVRYKARTETRSVPVTRDGRTHHIQRTITIWEPQPPRDIDLIVRRTVLTVATALLVGAIVWSTVSIGSLLSTVTHPAAAYGAAAVFDGAWIVALALEWLARYDTDRARAPRAAGHLALALAMTAITTHGHLQASLWVGIVGATASALAKLCWTLVMRHHTHDLDEETAAWLAAERSELAAAMVTGSLRREAARAEAQHAALRTALGLPAGQQDTAPDTRPGVSGHADATVRAAVRAAAATLPDATPEAIAAHLAAVGIDITPDTVTEHMDSRPDRKLTLVKPGVAEAVRTALSAGVTTPDAVVRYVRTQCPDASPDTITRTLRRITKEAS